jgi:hypothetical protein
MTMAKLQFKRGIWAGGIAVRNQSRNRQGIRIVNSL